MIRASGDEASARTARLLDGSSREVLARLVEDDPLGLRSRIAARTEERALLVDAELVHLRSLALCARRASSRGADDLATWLDELVERALDDVLSEEWSSRDEREPAGCEIPWRHFAAQLELDPRGLRAGCARFNRLPFEQREAFFRLVLDAGSPDHAARARGLSFSEIARRARAALDLVRSTAVPGSAGSRSA